MIENIFVENPEDIRTAYIQEGETVFAVSFSNDEIKREKLSDFNMRKFRNQMKDISWNTRLKKKVRDRYDDVIRNLKLDWNV